ncbi:MAG: hypothetical protein ACTSYS_07745 [Promethearchaeota archaeon]
MGKLNVLHKIGLIGLIVATVPLMGYNMLLPRLGIATAGLNIEFADLTIADYNNETVVLDFWLKLGLPRVNESIPYYDDSENVITSNLEDASAFVIIPRLSLHATFKGQELGRGSTPTTYILNSSHPVEFIHLYLNCSRLPDSGLMYLFSDMVGSGTLDSLLLDAIQGSSSGFSFSADDLLKDLDLTLTAYMGGAPIQLSGSSLLTGGAVFPVIKQGEDIKTSEIENVTQYPINQYDPKRDESLGSMDRFTSQLPLDDALVLLGNLIPGLVSVDPDTGEASISSDLSVVGNILLSALSQLEDDTILEREWTFNLTTYEKVWINSSEGNGTIYDAHFLNESSLIEMGKVEIDALHASDSDFTVTNVSEASALIPSPDDLIAYLNDWAGSNTTKQSEVTQTITNLDDVFTKVRNSDYVDIEMVANLFNSSVISEAMDEPAYGKFNSSVYGEVDWLGIESNFANLFLILNFDGYGLEDLLKSLGLTVPDLLTVLLFSSESPTHQIVVDDPVTGDPVTYTYYQEPVDQGSLEPVLGETIKVVQLLLVSIIAAFVILFLLMSITKGSVKINRADFLSRSDVQRNTSQFIKRVESLGGKVSQQNAEALAIRAFKALGKIESAADIEKRAKTYVENQKLLVTLQSRASRAYVAQKFKDCITAIEKMIDIARKLEDQTLVENYQENLSKVVKLLRRKGIAVRTRVRAEEEKPTEELEKLRIYKKELVDLQNRASKYFAEKNWAGAKDCIKQMLSIANKIQDPVLIRNYEANLRKIIALEKGES